MKQNRPKEMNLIGSLYIVEGIAVLLALAIRGEAGLYTGLRELITNVPANVLIPVVTLLKFIISYGYLTLTRWGYWLMMLYSIIVILMNGYLMLQFGLSLYIWQTMFSIYVLKYTFENKDVFINHQADA